MTFAEYFECIKKKPVTFKQYPAEYIIDGEKSWWAVYKKLSGCPECLDGYFQIGFFANTFNENECVLHAKVLEKNVTIKVKIDDFKLLENG